MFRDGLRAALSDIEHIEVCGEAADADTAVERGTRLRPDVVLMDLDLGSSSGIDATRRLTAAVPETAVLVLTMHDAESSVFAALCAGACGYLLKGVDQEELLRAVRGAAAGEAVFGAGIARRVLSRLRAEPAPEPATGPEIATTSTAAPRSEVPATHGLTTRECEILDLMAEGWGNGAIAERLYLSPKTVRNNVSTILGKLHAANRGEAVVRARGWGLGSGTDPG
jgi:DNA-binding NarL/FixJ family response regulator